jgi:hypothetical protein
MWSSQANELALMANVPGPKTMLPATRKNPDKYFSYTTQGFTLLILSVLIYLRTRAHKRS